MLAYNDIDTYTFVWLYDAAALRANTANGDAGAILRSAGFTRKDGRPLELDLRAVAAGSTFANPTMVTLAGGEAFLECKSPREFGGRLLEVQLGSGYRKDRGLYDVPGFTKTVRDRLVTAIEQLASLDGMEVGFSLQLCDEANEADYRTWLAECVVGTRLSLCRLVMSYWLELESIVAGPSQVATHGRDVFLKCPAWRISEPREDVICVFMHNLVTGFNPAGLDEVGHDACARDYLREQLTYDVPTEDA